MDAFITTLRAALGARGTWELNGLLATLYTARKHAALAAAGAFVALLFWTPPGRRSASLAGDQLSGQRPRLLGIGLGLILASFLAPAPMLVLLAAMTIAGTVAVKLDRFNPDALRWRLAGGLVLCALAALAYLAYDRYLDALDANCSV